MEIFSALITLILLEIVLGIDNIIFISILSSRLPHEQQNKARITGLALAMITRILLLFSLTLIMKLTTPLFTITAYEISGRDMILILGGLFLIAKSTHEIHSKLEGGDHEQSVKRKKANFVSTIIMILLLDVVFSLDSVITAIGMANDLWVMVTAVIVSVIFMMFTSKSISNFVDRHPTVKILALSFLILIGVSLIGEGLDQHIPKGYIYFAMAFSVFVEMLNQKMKKNTGKPVKLKSNMD
jgi:predicted tellurium resistance membrane protein TerC